MDFVHSIKAAQVVGSRETTRDARKWQVQGKPLIPVSDFDNPQKRSK